MEHHRLVGIIKARAIKGNHVSGTATSSSVASSSGARSGSSGRSSVVVADMMAGVGPFAVPLAMPENINNTTATSNNNGSGSGNGGNKGKQNNGTSTTSSSSSSSSSSSNIIVHANDLNPASYRYLVINGKNNKCRLVAYSYLHRKISLIFILFIHDP